MIVIISSHQEFAEVLAAHISRELGYECRVFSEFPTEQDRPKEQIILTISHHTPPSGWPGESYVLEEKSAPLRLQPLLASIKKHAEVLPEKLMLGRVVFLPRAKRLEAGSPPAVELTDKEVRLLMCLYKAGKTGVEKESLLRQVWGVDPDTNTNVLETHLYRLRNKLRELGQEPLILAVEQSYKLAL